MHENLTMIIESIWENHRQQHTYYGIKRSLTSKNMSEFFCNGETEREREIYALSTSVKCVAKF